jgi:hypothetical protein
MCFHSSDTYSESFSDGFIRLAFCYRGQDFSFSRGQGLGHEFLPLGPALAVYEVLSSKCDIYSTHYHYQTNQYCVVNNSRVAFCVGRSYDAGSAVGPVPHVSMQGVRMVNNYDWSSSYATAVIELDQHKLSMRILDAELAILRRTHEPGLARREWQAIEVAIDILQDMRMRCHTPLYDHRIAHH